MIDTLFTAEEAGVLDTGPRPLSAVKTLKLRGNVRSSCSFTSTGPLAYSLMTCRQDTLGNTSIDKLLRYLPSLERLDLSFISTLRSLALPPAIIPRLTKLHLTGTTKLSPSSIINQLVDTPCVALETLQLGALGGSDRPWTVDDVLMLGVVCALSKGSLRKLVLAGNATLVGSELAGIPSSAKVSAFSQLLVTVAPFVEVRPTSFFLLLRQQDLCTDRQGTSPPFHPTSTWTSHSSLSSLRTSPPRSAPSRTMSTPTKTLALVSFQS